MKTTILLLASLLFLNFSKKDKEIENLFSKTKKIEIYAFQSFSGNYLNPHYIKTNKVEIPEKYLRNKIVLNELQFLKLKKKLIKTKDKIEERADCYDPRHIIVFYKENEEILGYVEICFSCINTKSSENLKFLEDKMLFQCELFKEFGITYFEDTKEEEEEKIRLREEYNKEMQKKLKKALEIN